MRCSRLVLAAISGFCSIAPAAEPAGASSPPLKALFVGCTRYPELPGADLSGPSNNVVLLKKVLQRFQLKAENTVTLVEGPDLSPTRANIEREFKRFAANVRPDQQVVIYLGGHGAQQPDTQNHPYLQNNDEMDGIDEVFLPSDARELATGRYENAIVDDELNDWVRAIAAQGARVWLIIDACHSGTLLRAPESLVVRRVPSSRTAAQLLQQAQVRAAERFGGRSDTALAFVDRTGSLDNIVVIYAALSHEPTVELPFDAEAGRQETYGLLTHTLCEVLSRAQPAVPLTYRELVQQIVREYMRMGRTSPTPLVEGGDRDREVLGLAVWPDRSRLLLRRNPRGGFSLIAGSLQGVSRGSIFAVYPSGPTGAVGRPLGYVKVKATAAFQSDVVPCEFGSMPAVNSLPEGAACECVYFEFGDLKVRLGLHISKTKKLALKDEELAALRETLRQIAREGGSPLEFSENAEAADWRLNVEGDQLYFAPAQGVVEHQGENRSPQFGPYTAAEAVQEVGKWAATVARAQMLLRLASGASAGERRGDVSVSLAVHRHTRADDSEGEELKLGGGEALFEGDYVSFRVRNNSKQVRIYPTLLFIDNQYGIQPVFPLHGQTAESIAPGEDGRSDVWTVNADTIGTERLVCIAVRATGTPVDFSSLAQPRLEQPRSQTRGAMDPYQTPLGKLLRNALYGEGGVRGLSAVEVADYEVAALSWRTSLKRDE